MLSPPTLRPIASIFISLIFIFSLTLPTNGLINIGGNVVDTFNNLVDIFGFSQVRMELYCAHPALVGDLDDIKMGTDVTELIRLNVLKPCFTTTEINLDLNLSNLFHNLIDFDLLVDSGEQIGCQYECPVGRDTATPIGWGRTHVCLESRADGPQGSRTYKVGCSLFGNALQFLRRLSARLQQRVSAATAAICPPAKCAAPQIFCVASDYQQFPSHTTLLHTFTNFGLSPDLKWGLRFSPQFDCDGSAPCDDPDAVVCRNGVPMIGNGQTCAREAYYTGPFSGFEWPLGYTMVPNSACAGLADERPYAVACPDSPLQPTCGDDEEPTSPPIPCSGAGCGCSSGGCVSHRSQNVNIHDINSSGQSSVVVNAFGPGINNNNNNSKKNTGTTLKQLKEKIENLVDPLDKLLDRAL